MNSILEVDDICHSFGDVTALDHLTMSVEPGTVRGLLGPNGAGKTTLIRIIATLLKPSSGDVTVDGWSIDKDSAKVRSVIGLAGQAAAVDAFLTGRENLEIVGRLYQLSKKEAQKQAQIVLERLDLVDAADRTVRTYSGGMKRRLDLGASLVGRPKILLLDEPTTGLDPRTRQQLWDFLKELQHEGTTVLLTTQYLEEADALADSITVIDKGTVVGEGTTETLKAKVGGDHLLATPTNYTDCEQVRGILAEFGNGEPRIDQRLGRVSVPVSDRVAALVAASQRFEHEGVTLSDLGIQRPTLDDVFLALTGHQTDASLQDASQSDQDWS